MSSSTPPFKFKPLTQLLGSNGPIHALTYSSSPGTYILTGSGDRNIRLYNPFPTSSNPTNTNPNSNAPQASRLIQTYSAHGYEVLDLVVAHDNATFTSCGGDRSLFIWDVSSARTIRRLSGPAGHTARINSVCYGASSSVLISGSFDASVRIWDLRSQSTRPIQVLLEAKDSVSAVSVNGKREWEIVAGSVDARVRYYDVRMGRCETDVLAGPVTSLTCMRGGEACLVGTLDGAVRLLDRASGTCLMAYKGHVNKEFRIRNAFGGREKWVLCGSEIEGVEGEVWVWNTLTGEVVRRVVVVGVAEGDLPRKKVVGADGVEKRRRNVVSCVAWKDEGRGDQWCCAGTDGVVTVFGEG